MVDMIRKDANDSLIWLEFKLLDRITSSLLGDSEAPKRYPTSYLRSEERRVDLGGRRIIKKR